MEKSFVFVTLSLMLSVTVACKIFENSIPLSVGVTPEEADQLLGCCPSVVYSETTYQGKGKGTIIYDTEKDLIPVNAYFLVDRHSGDDLNRQADVHVARGNYKSNSIVCVKTNVTHARPSVFVRLWWKTMRFVVMETADSSNYIYDPFNDRIVRLNGTGLSYIFKKFAEIWKNMKRLEIRVTAIQESLSFFGKRAGIGLGLDSSFLYEIAKHHNFTPIIIDGRNYRFSNLQVWRHQVEFGVNSRFLTVYDQKYTFSAIIYGDDMCNVVRRNKYLRGWDVFRSLFHNEVWLSLFAAVGVIHLLLLFICPNRRWSTWLGITVRSLLTISVKPVIRETKERLIIGSCYLFSLIFTSCVQAMLYQTIRRGPLTEIPTADLMYKYVHVMRDTPYDGAFTVMRKKEYTLSVSSGLIDPDEYITMCPGYTRNMAYLMNYGSALEPLINNFVRSSFEAGLPDAWYAKTLMLRRKKRQAVKEKVQVLTILDFEVAFFELLIGLSISSAVFAVEAAIGTYSALHTRLRELEFVHSRSSFFNRPFTA